MKRRLRHYLDSWNFTPTERTVILTLAGAFILGLGIRMFRGEAGVPSTGFDYASADAEFAARSAAPPADSPAPPARDSAETTSGEVPRSHVSSSVPAFRIELNRATRGELMRLPGIGDVIAGRILRYREERGGFGSVEELLKVGGIGAKKLGKIAPYCYVEKE